MKKTPRQDGVHLVATVRRPWSPKRSNTAWCGVISVGKLTSGWTDRPAHASCQGCLLAYKEQK